MGEVYRARDEKLDRTVAVKVLPPHLAEDREALARFEREAKAVAALSHPSILAIFDFGTGDGVSYAAMELLEGESMRARLVSGPLSPRKAVEYGLQVCQALAAAHEKGIVHRDLKPENVFITHEGRVKVLDFGLAKVGTAQAPTTARDPRQGETLELIPMTEPGTVMGTVGYMSPEQVRGEATDHRSDIFSFGSMLYEMLSGQRAFKGDSAVETMSAILKSEPPDLVESNRSLNPALERIVRHCLEKRPGERFQSARDLAFQLEALSAISSTTGSGTGLPAGVGTRRLHPALVPLGLLAVLGAGFLAGRRSVVPRMPSFQQITFRRGNVSAARFAPDGQTVVYSAAWEGSPVEVLTTRPESPESRSLGLASAGVFAVSSSGEMAIAVGCEFFWGGCHGTLSRVPLEGGSPREMLNDVHEADWTPDGRDLAVVRDAQGRHRLELPVGHVLYETSGWISSTRVSPRGDLVAFIDHPSPSDDGGSVAVVDRAGKVKTLAAGWSSAWGLAWPPSGQEVWFTAAERGRVQSLRAVTLMGDQRVILRAPARLILHDVSPTGRLLLAHESARTGLRCLSRGESKERDLSWFDGSSAADLSRDGRRLLFCERGEGTRATPMAYIRDTDGAPAENLGEGRPLALSPDGSWALIVRQGPPAELVLLPTGAGEARTLPAAALTSYVNASFFPSGDRLLILASEAGHQRRCYVQDLTGGPPRPVSPEGASVDFAGNPVSPDGKRFAVRGADGRVGVLPTEGGSPLPVGGLEPGAVPLGWSADGRSLFAWSREQLPARIVRVDLATAKGEIVRELRPTDAVGIVGISTVSLTPDGGTYAYTYDHRNAELYLAEGLN
jgi:Tol biopolymer transport system component